MYVFFGKNHRLEKYWANCFQPSADRDMRMSFPTAVPDDSVQQQMLDMRKYEC